MRKIYTITLGETNNYSFIDSFIPLKKTDNGSWIRMAIPSNTVEIIPHTSLLVWCVRGGTNLLNLQIFGPVR